MRLLSNQHRYANGQMTCRSLRPFIAGQRIILAVHGGPGLSGQYLEPFLVALAKATEMNVALLDLPNHGESVLRKNAAPLDYRRTVALLESAISQIAKETGGIVLLGQSFGARLAVDILSTDGAAFEAAILLGMPHRFEHSGSFTKSLANIAFDEYAGDSDDEAVFVRNWRKVLPFYTPKPLPAEAIELLAAGTRWRGNERMLEGVPALEKSAARIKDRNLPILVIQGRQDMIVPDDNLRALRANLPQANFMEMPEAGHFVMLEVPSTTVVLIAEYLKEIRCSP